MKQVVHTLSTDIITTIKNARPDRYYGIQQTDGEKGFVTKSNYFDGHYRESFVEDLTDGNSTMMDADSKIKDLTAFLEFKLSNGDRKIYEFETGKELFDWLTD